MNSHQAAGTTSLLRYLGTEEIAIANDRGTNLPASEHDRFGISLKGAVRIVHDASRPSVTDIEAGEMFYLPANVTVDVQMLAPPPVPLLCLCFDRIAADARRESDIRAGLPDRVQPFRMPQMKNWIGEFRALSDRQSKAAYYRCQSRLYAIAAACASAAESADRRSLPAPIDRVEHARLQISNHYDAPLEIESFARGTDASPSLFYRLFREHTGLSPQRLLTATRLRASLRLLSDPGMSIAAAAHSVGYLDEFYFSRLFRKEMGMSPTEYARSSRVAIANLCPVFAGDLAALGLHPRISLPRGWAEDRTNRDAYLRKIRQAEPDYILTAPLSEQLHRSLTEIAPVLSFEWHRYAWQTRLSEIAGLLGLAKIAERWLAGFEQRKANARKLIHRRLRTTPFLIIGHRERNYRLYGGHMRKFTDLIYEELHVAAPPSVASFSHIDAGTLREAAKMGCGNAIFIVEYPMSDRDCRRLEEEWRCLMPDSPERRCLFVRLEEPFLYNADMHERLIDEIVRCLHADNAPSGGANRKVHV